MSRDYKGNDRHNKFVTKFVDRLKGEAGIPAPANVANSTLHYDTVFILADIIDVYTSPVG